MKNIFKAAVVAAALCATPAMAAGEGRVEARGGIAWAGGADEFVGGVAAGYDFDLGDSAFVGGEVSYDTDFDGFDGVNLAARLGGKIGKGKLYATVGYDVADIDEFNIGAGYQHSFGDKVYGKVEYRRYLLNGTDLNAAVVGIGLKF